MINLLSKTDDFIKIINLHSKIHDSLNNGYVEGSFISLLEPVGAQADPKSVVRNLVAPRTCSPPNLVAPRTCSPPNRSQKKSCLGSFVRV